jgi:hypothetical protein
VSEISTCLTAVKIFQIHLFNTPPEASPRSFQDGTVASDPYVRKNGVNLVDQSGVVLKL